MNATMQQNAKCITFEHINLPGTNSKWPQNGAQKSTEAEVEINQRIFLIYRGWCRMTQKSKEKVRKP